MIILRTKDKNTQTDKENTGSIQRGENTKNKKRKGPKNHPPTVIYSPSKSKKSSKESGLSTINTFDQDHKLKRKETSFYGQI